MLLQLKTGFTIEIPIETYLDMSDQEIEDLECLSHGQLMEINNPFHKPYANNRKKKKKTPKKEKNLLNISDEEKMKDFYDYEKEDY